MKKIGLVTFYDGINAGGFLQAFALKSYLENSKFDYEISFIKNPNKSLFFKDLMDGVIRKNIFQSFSHIRKGVNFKKKIDKFKISEATEEFDLIIFGSDIIWNFDKYSVEDQSFYFGSELISKNKISYAASIGHLSDTKTLPGEIINSIQTFKKISVRDKKTLNFLSNNTNLENIEIVPDPTILIGQDFWKKLLNNSLKNYPNNFIAVYSYLQNTEDYLEKIKRKNNEKFLSIGYPYKSKKVKTLNFNFLDPLSWIRIISESSAMITSTFHGVLFSIILNKPFYYLKNDASLSKVSFLLSELNLTKLIISRPSDLNLELFEEIEWKSINESLEKMSNQGQKFLSGSY